jgi:DNA gyrase subunit A
LESDKVRDEHKDLMERIGELRTILGDPARVDAIIVEELDEVNDRYGDDRRTEGHALRGRHEHRGHDRRPADGDLDHPLRLRQAAAARHLQAAAPGRPRGDGDGHERGRLHRAPPHLLDHDFLLFFTNRGKVYRLKVYELPEGSRTSKGGPWSTCCRSATARRSPP